MGTVLVLELRLARGHSSAPTEAAIVCLEATLRVEEILRNPVVLSTPLVLCKESTA